MQLRSFVVKTTLVLAVLAAVLAWLACTNGGLNTVLTIASYFAPVKVNYQTAHGSLWGRQIIIANISVAQNQAHLNIAEATINWRAGSFKLVKIQGFEEFLPGQQFLAIGKDTNIQVVTGKITRHAHGFDLQTTIHGTWQQARLDAYLAATYADAAWLFHKAQLSVGKNSAQLQTDDQQQISWTLQLLQPEIIFANSHGALQAAGNINLSATPDISATIVSKSFGLQAYQIRNLNAALHAAYSPNAPLNLLVTADNLNFDNHKFARLNLQIKGTYQQHVISFNSKYNDKILAIAAHANATQDVWQAKDLQINYDQQILRGNIEYTHHKQQAALNLQGNLYKTDSKITAQMLGLNNYVANLSLYANQQNHLHADLSLQQDNINGNVTAVADDLSMVMQLLPDVTRLKGHFTANAKISGTLQKPQISAAAHITEITATLPNLGVKIKPMELHIHNEGMEKLVLHGSGKMRRGPGEFTISGYIEPFKANMPNELNFTGKEVEFINTTAAHLVANQKLTLKHDLAANQLNVSGHIDILRGNIYFDPKKASTVKSKDVVFIDSKAQTKQDSLKINPHLNIWVFEEVHFSGFGLDADISGNLDISQRNETLYGSGRVTIKQGTFQLPGQKLSIHKGRLLYPVGTLLTNPSLDIKMLDGTPGSNMEIVVRGTAQTPSIHESGIGQDKAMSQAMLVGSSVLSKNLLQDKLKLTELGFANSDNQHAEFSNDHSSYNKKRHNPMHDKNSLRNKDLVVGRRLTDKLYLQYLQSMDSDKNNKRGRLKYALNDIWSLDLEAGNQGAGADLSFVIERD